MNSSVDKYFRRAVFLKTMWTSHPVQLSSRVTRASYENGLRERYGLRVVASNGDGNCLYRSIAQQVYGNQNLHKIVRQAVVDLVVADVQGSMRFFESDKDLENVQEWVTTQSADYFYFANCE
jgi:OTU-like cysteine protease